MKLKYINNCPKGIKLYATQKTYNILNGKYQNIIKNNNTIFNSLRQYEINDNIKFIDWKSSVKHQKLLIKEFEHEQNQNITIILDSSYTFNAHTDKNELKKIVSIYICATLGSISINNNDKLSIIIDNNYYKISNIYTLDNKLQEYEQINKPDNTINNSLTYISNNITKKNIIFIITDIKSLNNINIKLINQLSKYNDILIININDHNLTENNMLEIETNKIIPNFLIKDKKLLRREIYIKEKIIKSKKKQLSKHNIPITNISSVSEINTKLIKLLEEYKYAIK